MSGHSHWAKIKRAKAGNDAKRGKVWSKIARKIIIAARAGGGDPRENLTLRYTIDEGRAENMPKDTIEKAIAKGTGELGGENYEACVYEGYAPGGIAFMVDALTNNRSRTAPELRKVFEGAGGNLAQSGSVAFQFSRQGLITIKADAVTEDKLIELALDAGAEDVRNEVEAFVVITAPTAMLKVREAITSAGIAVLASEVSYVPSTTIPVDKAHAERVLRLVDALEDNEDVQSVAHNAEFPEGM